jgi:hypothetical protein
VTKYVGRRVGEIGPGNGRATGVHRGRDGAADDSIRRAVVEGMAENEFFGKVGGEGEVRPGRGCQRFAVHHQGLGDFGA